MFMPRALRIEYAGACYHVMCRGDRREEIFRSDADRELFLATLGQACKKTGWQVHAYVLMPNHYHLIVETPEPNLVDGMRWFQGTYTARFNRRHRLSGHLFQGRYKALLVDAKAGGYLQTASTYVHLNPVRAGLVRPGDVPEYPWSSVPCYASQRRRPGWLRVDRVLGELGLGDSPADRRRYMDFLTKQGGEDARSLKASTERYAGIRRGWCFGDPSFREDALERVGKRAVSRSHSGAAALAHGEAQAIRLISAGLKRMGVDMDTVRGWTWREPRKRALARLVRSCTTMTNGWVGAYLGGGHDSTVSRAVHEQG